MTALKAAEVRKGATPASGHHPIRSARASRRKLPGARFASSTSWLSFLRSQLNDVMNFIAPFARGLEPGQNYPDHTIFDFDEITHFELRFVRSASKSLALWFVLHLSNLSILPQHE